MLPRTVVLRKMDESEDPYLPRKDDHLVEPMYSGLGLDGDEEAAELLHEVDPDERRPGRLLRWIRSARDVMRGRLSRPGRDR